MSTHRELRLGTGRPRRAAAIVLYRRGGRPPAADAARGLFASHPETKERIDTIHKLAGSKTGAEGQARYAANIKYDATPVTAIAVVPGSAGLTGSTGEAKKDDSSKKNDSAAKKDANADDQSQPKKKGFGLGSLTASTSQDSKSTQVAASGGARGLGPDRAAKGGGNPTLVAVTITFADLAAFKKGIA